MYILCSLDENSRHKGRETLSLMVVQMFLQADGFPTILFFPAGNKSFDPVSGIQSFNTYIFSILLV